VVETKLAEGVDQAENRAATDHLLPKLYHKLGSKSTFLWLSGLSQIFGGFTPHRPEEPVLGKPKVQHRLFTAVREIPLLLSS